MIANPILLNLPIPIETSRLTLRPPQTGDGKAYNEAVLESFAELSMWMPWAKLKPTVDEDEEFARRAAAKWILREELGLWIYDKSSGEFIGAIWLHNIDWHLPCFEMGTG